MQQQGARSRHQQSNKRMSWTVADVQKECFCDRTFWTSTDLLQDAQVVLEMGSTQRNAERELNKKWWTRVMQLKLRLVETLWKIQMQIKNRGKLVGQISVQAGRRA